jgi:NAD(P)-dependent dehydrogenase (short-subunit alcohol dehydrogenase family)
LSRCILITGATGKIGRVLTRHFLSAGDTVVAAGRSVDALAQLKVDMSSTGGSLQTLRADLMAPNATATLVDGLGEIGCMPDGLINNARNVSFLKLGEDGLIARQDFLDELALDVITPYELVMALANTQGSHLRSVVNIGSQYGAVAPNLHLYKDPTQQSPLQYGVAKAALAHLTKELAVRLANRGIRVNCVAFGGVEGRVDDAFKQRYASLCPMGRMLGEHELAGPVDLLLSDAASAVTGHIMMVDGGWSVW